MAKNQFQIDYETTPGYCMASNRCPNVGPRCVQGYCFECCAGHNHDQELHHPPPPKGGAFAPYPAIFVAATKITGGSIA